MAAKRDKTSSIADSIKALMVALDDELLPSADDLRKQGWVSAEDYAKASSRSTRTAKILLDGCKSIKKKKAKGKHRPMMMYKV